MIDAFRSMGVAVVVLDHENAPADDLARLAWLRRRLAQDGVTTLVWLCHHHLRAFAFGMRLAPVQIWWSMAYHPNIEQDCDGYLTLRNGFEPAVTVNGRRWLAIRFSHPFLVDQDQAGPAAEVRARFPADAVLFGTLAREEKIASEGFLATVCTILHNNPNAVWLYTGHDDPPLVRRIAEEHGVAAQAIFIGWVDTKLYSQVIDIFIEFLAAGIGLTVMEAMAAAKPVLILHHSGPQCLGHYIFDTMASASVPDDIKAMITDCFSAERPWDLLPCGETAAQVGALGTRLVRDADYRRRCSAAARRFAERVFLDHDPPAHQFAEHLLAITGRKLGGATSGSRSPTGRG